MAGERASSTGGEKKRDWEKRGGIGLANLSPHQIEEERKKLEYLALSPEK